MFLGYEKIKEEPVEPLEAWKDELDGLDYEVVSTTTYYRYRDKEWLWQETKDEYYTKNDINKNFAYYATSPETDYVNSNNETTAYKWYTNEVLPKELLKVYVCKNVNGSNNLNSVGVPCEEKYEAPSELVRIYYTCGVRETLEDGSLGKYIEVPENSVCDCSNDKLGKYCGVEKKYYPSGSETANKESVYYANSPIEGAIKDVSTQLNVSRYYKSVTTVTSKYYVNSPSNTAVKVGNGRWGNWSEYTTTKPKQYNTREIESRDKIKYQLKKDIKDQWKKVNNEYQTEEQLISKLQALNLSTHLPVLIPQ